MATAADTLAPASNWRLHLGWGIGTLGASLLLNSANVRAFLNLLINLTDTNILSTPQVLAADNQKAKIVVGENRPFPTGQAQGITGGTLVTIERKDVGVTLELTPQVLEDDLIRLEIKQEITAIAENVAQTIGSGSASIPVGPTTTKRSMETTTIAQDLQTIVVGGLVRDNITLSEKKIPFLGDIPWLGWAFKSQNRQTEKLNLLVFLTPHLVRDDADMAESLRASLTARSTAAAAPGAPTLRGFTGSPRIQRSPRASLERKLSSIAIRRVGRTFFTGRCESATIRPYPMPCYVWRSCFRPPFY